MKPSKPVSREITIGWNIALVVLFAALGVLIWTGEWRFLATGALLALAVVCGSAGLSAVRGPR